MRARGDAVAETILIRRGDPPYPEALLDLGAPPDLLYALGDTRTLAGAPDRTAAVVGTRDASPYGVRVAAELASAFAAAGICVVSGMARGVDASAHRGALASGGRTIAVLGSGVDVPYPVGHRALHQAIVQNGVVLSEYESGRAAAPWCFPHRNRIIAALSRVTIVVEAPYKSGAVNTATHALELGRIVAAVPGPIDSRRSAGANLLLRDGAQVIATVDDALGLFGVSRRKARDVPALTHLESVVWAALASGAAPPEVLGDRAGIPVREVLEGVARLELIGLVRQAAGGEIERLALG